MKIVGTSALLVLLLAACGGVTVPAERRVSYDVRVLWHGPIPPVFEGNTLLAIDDASAWARLVEQLGPAHEDLGPIAIDWPRETVLCVVMDSGPGVEPVVSSVARSGDRLEVSAELMGDPLPLGVEVWAATLIAVPRAATAGDVELVGLVPSGGNPLVTLPRR